MPAKIVQRKEKLFLYFENTVGPKISVLDDEGNGRDLTGGLFEIVVSTARGGLLMFKSVEGTKTETKKPKYLSSVYRGAR